MVNWSMVLTGTDLTTAGIDFDIVDALIECVKSVIGLFTIYPLNIYMTGGIVLLCAGIFGALKHS